MGYSAIRSSILFNPIWYKSQLDNQSDPNIDEQELFLHYRNYGARLKLSPHPLFSAKWYVDSNQSAQKAFENGMDPLEHFLSHGAEDNLWPNPLFNMKYYIDNCQVYREHLSATDPLSHFIRFGSKHQQSPHLLFDIGWYIENNPGISEMLDMNLDPLSHFLMYGAHQGFSPHPLFDTKWYLQQNKAAQEALAEGIDPLSHFIQFGSKELYWPNPLFDTKRYLAESAGFKFGLEKGIDALTYYLQFDRERSVSTHELFDINWYKKNYVSPTGPEQDPLIHFCKIGRRTNNPCPFGRFNFDAGTISINKPDLTLSETPLVSIIVVNFNGRQHLSDLCEGLRSQTYKNFELIFVDNGSTDGSIETISKLDPTAKVIQLESNVGFACANNQGFLQSRGELIVLLNNDTYPQTAWLEGLVVAAKNNPDAAAVTSKVLFWEKFASLQIASRERFSLCKATLLQSLDYLKIIQDYGSETDEKYFPEKSGSMFVLELKLPITGTGVDIKISTTEPDAALTLKSRYSKDIINVKEANHFARYNWSEYDKKYAKFVINNAGSHEPKWLQTGDIGFGEYDNGQYNRECRVDLICGCSVAIKRNALDGRHIFFKDFVAYYEDSELSRRLRAAGFDLIYTPTSVVRHKHSATSVEKSNFWLKYVNRNKVIYEYLFEDALVRNQTLDSRIRELNHYSHWLNSSEDRKTDVERRSASIYPQIIEEIKTICESSQFKNKSVERTKRIGIYNRFWNTLGGGEAHALRFAAILQKHGIVELISNEDFEISVLEKYFSMDLSSTCKRIIRDFNTGVTSDYDLLINSSYMDETPSIARKSYYIVSFPSKNPSLRFLQSYNFIPNSNYTLSWMKKYWGNTFKAELVFPSVPDILIPDGKAKKEKIILSVGRFFKSGHSKNQVEIAKAFKSAVENNSTSREWKLVMMGSVNDQDYFEEVRKITKSLNCELVPNASIAEVKAAYESAYAYVHAAGLGKHPDDSPADFEHFGMTVAEAVTNRCFPIVYDAAGPSEIIDLIGIGQKYKTEVELSEAISLTIKTYNDEISRAKIIDSLSKKSSYFERTVEGSKPVEDMLTFLQKVK
ncbi:glycosyltransferase [Methylobacterium organophilum]|uniref:glycosyltransferase n=1 Tax=Methylobacterium organophilum TaxID=410 RepID=UPI001F12C115|nr:glycosyltransferase [Methylobacterium organophilum]UMY19257.1 glycosyltransferase [Methylobacterium organophilum]